MTLNTWRPNHTVALLFGILTFVPYPAIADSSDPCAYATSQQAQSHCASRDNANNTGTIETVKGVINFAGAATNLAFFTAGMASGTDLSKVCDSYTFGVNGANIGWDVTAQATMQNNMQATAGSIGSLASFGNQIKNAAKDGLQFGGEGAAVAPKEGAEKATGKQVASANSACLINAGTLGATGATNTITASGARQGANAENAVIAPLVQAEQAAYSFPTSHGTGSTVGAYTEGAGNSAQSCMGLSGQAFLSCLGNSDPSLSSLFSDPKLKDLKGYKNLDSILKSAIQSGDPSAIRNAASALSGASPTAMEKLMKASEEAIQKNALAGKGPKGGAALAKAKNKNLPDPKDSTYDKLLKDMMDKLAAGNKAESTDTQTDLQDRQMDLLSAEQIEARKDISLFHRVAFRYKRKALDMGRIPAKDPAP